MKRARIRALTVLLLVALRPVTAEQRSDPPQGLFSEAWMTVKMEGQKIGYTHHQQIRREQDIHTIMQMSLTVRRAGQEVTISITDKTTESITGQPRSFENVTRIAEQPVKVQGTIEQGKVHVISEQYGQQLKQVVDYPQGALMNWGMFLESIKHKPEQGVSFDISAYVPMQALNTAIPTTITVVGPETINLVDDTVEAIKTHNVTTLSGVEIQADIWVDQQWEPLKQTLQFMGLQIEMVRCDKAYALKDLSSAELFTTTLIPLNRSIDRDKARSVTYRISSRSDSDIPDIPETQMQRIIERKKGQLTLRVSRIDHEAIQRRSRAQPPPELSEYLESSIFITSGDPVVVEMARNAAEDEKDPYSIAVRMCHTVDEQIDYKGLGTAFATAAEVSRNKEGDCTEHGVLLAALGRAAGIPARVVTGLIYVPFMLGQRDVLGFHMWAQYWIGGTWIDLDPSWGQVNVDPTHIALATHSTKNASMGNLVSSSMLRISDLQITIIEVEETEN